MRPLKPIDWKLVDELLEAGCQGTEIAPFFDLHPDTFYDRVAAEKGVGFTVYSQQKKSKGDALLKKVQFDKATGKSELGDNTMLVWLGKTRLDQKESSEVSVSADTVKSFASVMNQLDELQKTRQNVPSKEIKVEDESNGSTD